ncbi:aminoglycoside phosphotransferase family protein [Streptomyces sp. 4N509B]|uniref:aminoglycoside phosphotransferase family protein n=1 Tax=Streptomyces sp. 4N509B TaxID=3457413 RepID=UPI003FD63709
MPQSEPLGRVLENVADALSGYVRDNGRAAEAGGDAARTLLGARCRPRHAVWQEARAGNRSAFVKRYSCPGPYLRELRALQQMPDGLAPRVLEHYAVPPTLVLDHVPGVRFDDPAAGGPSRWLDAAVETVVASVGLPGSWEDDAPPELDELQAGFAAALAASAPASVRALELTLRDPLRVACHGDISPPNLLVSFDSPVRVWLLDYEFYGPGDPLADIAALCLTPSVDLPAGTRVAALRRGRELVEEKTGLRLAGRMAGSIALWAVQCAAWHRRHHGTFSFEQAVLENARLGIDASMGGNL